MELIEAPRWLVEMTAKAKPKAGSARARAFRKHADGERHNARFDFAKDVHPHGVHGAELLRVLEEWDSVHCEPGDGKDCPKIVKSLCKDCPEAETWEAPEEEQEPGIVSLEAFLGETYAEDPMLMEGIFPRQGTGLLAGESYSAKTTIAIGQAIAIAAGEPWFGFKVNGAAPVLFVELEGSRATFQKRVRAAIESAGHGCKLPIYFREAKAPEITFASPWLRRQIETLRPGFIVIDPFDEAFGDHDESTARDTITHFIKPLAALSEEFSGFFQTIHHFGKPAENRSGHHRTRGSSALRARVYTHATVEAKGSGRICLTFDKVKDHELPPAMNLALDGPRAMLTLLSEEDALAALEPYCRTISKKLEDEERACLKDGRPFRGLAPSKLDSKGGRKEEMEDARLHMIEIGTLRQVPGDRKGWFRCFLASQKVDP